MKILLASGSPRRRELLALAKVEFAVMRADIDERTLDQESPQDYIKRMVGSKAEAAISVISEQCAQAKSLTSPQMPIDEHTVLLLTADTIGISPDGKTILLKPEDYDQAVAMWQQMSGNTHQVCSAVQATLIDLKPVASAAPIELVAPSSSPQIPQVRWKKSIHCCTEVTFVDLTLEEMHRYWSSGEPCDKAGGYAIQGEAAAWVERINGSYTNVVGLPLAQTLALIEEAKLITANH